MLKVANSVIDASRITGVLPVANGGTNASTASITSFNNITGFTASGTTGTTSTNLVFATTPTLVGDVTLSTGNLVIGTSGKGIDFSATPGTGTSELLADYEEGTFTPTYITTGGSFSYASQLGRYTKIGRVVYCSFTISTSSATVGSGDVQIGGLPFTVENSGNARGGAGIGRSNGFASNNPIGILIFENEVAVYLTYKATVTGDTAYLPASSLNTGSGNAVFGSFYYTTAT